MHEPDEASLPRLVEAAACFALAMALAAAVAPGVLLAGSALLVLASPRALFLLPFLLAGLAAGILSVPGNGDEPRATTIETVVRVLTPSRSSSRGGQTCAVHFEETRARVLADSASGLMVEGSSAPERRRGERLLVRGTLVPSGPARNPGVAKERARLLADDVRPDPEPGAASRLRAAVDALANAIDRRLHERMSARPAALASALVLGRADRLDDALRDGLRSIGAWHFIAVSGSHVALLAAMLAWIFAASHVPQRAALAATALLVLGYAWLAGGEAPALRAVIGGLGAALALGRRRIPSAPSWLAAAFLVLVAIDPEHAREAGFQLSFVAVLGLMAAARYGTARSPKGTGTGIDLRAPVLRAARFALAAAIATAPLTAFHFGTLTPLAPAATLLLGPIVAMALATALASAASTALPACCTAAFGLPLAGFDALLAFAARAGDRLPATPLPVTQPALLAIVSLGACWLLLLARRPGFAAATALVVLAVNVAGLGEQRPEPSLTLLSAGHGQVALVRAEGRCDLFDAGSDGSLGANALARALREVGVVRLDGLFVSHLDADHAGLVASVLEEFEVGALYLPGTARHEIEHETSPLAVELRDALERCDVAVLWLAAGDRIGPHECLWPPDGRAFSQRNDGSLALRTRLGSETWLFSGDLEGFPLLEVAARVDGGNGGDRTSVLVLPHHGNADPGLAALLARVRPSLAFACRGERPLPEATRTALQSASVPWLSTSRGGAIERIPPAGPGLGTILRGSACR